MNKVTWPKLVFFFASLFLSAHLIYTLIPDFWSRAFIILPWVCMLWMIPNDPEEPDFSRRSEEELDGMKAKLEVLLREIDEHKARS